MNNLFALAFFSFFLPLQFGVQTFQNTNLTPNPVTTEVPFLNNFQCGQISDYVIFKVENEANNTIKWEDVKNLDSSMVTNLEIVKNDYSQFYDLKIVFNQEGSESFRNLTKNNIGKQMAIFIGDTLISSPYIQSEIIGGEAIISGFNNYEETLNLAHEFCVE